MSGWLAIYLGNRPLPTRTLGLWRYGAILLAIVTFTTLLTLTIGLTRRYCVLAANRRNRGWIRPIAGLMLLGSAALFYLDANAFRGLYFPLHLLLALLYLSLAVLGWLGLSPPNRSLRRPALVVVGLLSLHYAATYAIFSTSWAARSAAYDLTLYQQKAVTLLQAPTRWLRAALHHRRAPTSMPREHAGTRLAALRRQFPTSDPSRPPNLFLITYDSLPADHVNPSIRLPAFSTLMPGAVQFSAAYSPAAHTSVALASWAAARQVGQVEEIKSARLYRLLRTAGYQQLCILPWRSTSPPQRRELKACDLLLGQCTPAQVDRAVSRFVQTVDPRRPVFVRIHIMATHYERRGSRDEPNFIATLQRTDRAVKRWLDQFREAGLTKHAVVVLSADHGEAFGQHGAHGHEGNVYDEQVRVPLLIWSSARKQSMTYRQPVSVAWLGQTLLGLSGVVPPKQLSGPFIFSEQPVFTRERNYYGVIMGSHKLIFEEQRSTYELYDLLSDPKERRNLADAQPQIRERLAQPLGEHFGLSLP